MTIRTVLKEAVYQDNSRLPTKYNDQITRLMNFLS